MRRGPRDWLCCPAPGIDQASAGTPPPPDMERVQQRELEDEEPKSPAGLPARSSCRPEMAEVPAAGWRPVTRFIAGGVPIL